MFYCCECGKLQDTSVIQKEQMLEVKGVPITLSVNVRICNACGEEILDEELDNETLNAFYREYRRKMHLLTPEEIASIRERYGLSQISFSKLLGFGDKTITRYENGAIQDVCHDNLIRLMGNIESFTDLWNNRKFCLSPRDQEKINKLLNNYRKLVSKTIPYVNTTYYSSLYAQFPIEGEMLYAG